MKRKSLIVFVLTIALFIVGIDLTYADSSVSFVLPSGVRVEIVEMSFSNSSFTVSGCDGHSETCLINGQVPFGNDLELPKTFLKTLSVSYQGQTYSLDSLNMYNAWGVRNLEHNKVVRYFGGQCIDAKNCQFRGLFSDAAGAFVAEWKVVNGVSIRTVLTNSSDVVRLFMKYIDPPKYE